MDPGRLAVFIAERTSSSAVQVSNVHKLSGGAVQENWAADLELFWKATSRTIPVVVRCDAVSGVSDSRSRAEEFALLSAAFALGVAVPEPLWLGHPSVFGRDFFVMHRVQGVAAGHRLVRDASLGGDRV